MPDAEAGAASDAEAGAASDAEAGAASDAEAGAASDAEAGAASDAEAGAASDAEAGAASDADVAFDGGVACRLIVVTGSGAAGKTSFAHAACRGAPIVDGLDSCAAANVKLPSLGECKTLIVVDNTIPPAGLPAAAREFGAVPYLVIIEAQGECSAGRYSTGGYESWCALQRLGELCTDLNKHQWVITGGERAPWMSAATVHDLSSC